MHKTLTYNLTFALIQQHEENTKKLRRLTTKIECEINCEKLKGPLTHIHMHTTVAVVQIRSQTKIGEELKTIVQ